MGLVYIIYKESYNLGLFITHVIRRHAYNHTNVLEKGRAWPLRHRRPGEAVDSTPEFLMEAARDLVAICRALNRTSPAVHVLQSPPKGKRDVLAFAYRAQSEAVELAREVQDDPDDFGLDQVNGVAVAVLLRRISRDLQREADAWDQA